ncbi:MAG: potassium transporter TrkG [Candidatus Omnitrophota bacterium]
MMKKTKQSPIKLTSIQTLLLGFILIIFCGAELLTLPFACANGSSQPFIDALFNATSAITTTGLAVTDTGSFYSLFGQLVILILFQVGGLGYMIFIVLAILRSKNRLSAKVRMLLHESLNLPEGVEAKIFAKKVAVFTLLFEGIGAVLLTFYWLHYYPPLKAGYMGIFHSISSFCTAGFGLFPDSLVSCRKSIFVNITVIVLSLGGAIGFFVLSDLLDFGKKIVLRKKTPRLSGHSKLALLISTILIIIGTAIIFIAEGGAKLPISKNLLLDCAFQCISASATTGFNTLNISAMAPASLWTIIILMFIGASPGGTGGGIKTSSFGIIFFFLLHQLRGRDDVNIFKRKTPDQTVHKVFTIGIIAVLWVAVSTLILTFTEKSSFLELLFESVSAFGTVGLSMGITSSLSAFGKIILSISMLIGRVGPLAIGLSLIGKTQTINFEYAQADILVG